MSATQWLRDEAGDDEIGLLFTAVGEDLTRSIESVMIQASRRRSVESRLVELLEQAVDEGSDDAYGSVWICLILGELQCRSAIPVMLRALAGDDEPLCEASIDALRRMGEPAFDAIMQSLEGDCLVDYELAAYRVLEGASGWEHPYLLDEVRDFLLQRLQAAALPQHTVEGLALVLARLGERRAIEPLRGCLAARFNGHNGALADALDMLEENPEGLPLVNAASSWQERVAWLSGSTFHAEDIPSGEDA